MFLLQSQSVVSVHVLKRGPRRHPQLPGGGPEVLDELEGDLPDDGPGVRGAHEDPRGGDEGRERGARDPELRRRPRHLHQDRLMMMFVHFRTTSFLAPCARTFQGGGVPVDGTSENFPGRVRAVAGFLLGVLRSES